MCLAKDELLDVWPAGQPLLKVRAVVLAVSSNKRSIALGFYEKPTFLAGGAATLFLKRGKTAETWRDTIGGGEFEIRRALQCQSDP